MAVDYLAPGELFPSTATPPIQDGESLYSWCARFHRLNGGHNAQATSRLLFGHSTCGLRHDIPSRLENFHRKTRGLLDPPDELLHRRTLYGLHAPFLSDNARSEIQRYMLSGTTPRAPHQTGIAQSGRSPGTPLKYCPTCLTEQQVRYGFTWWHIAHQLPSSLVCHLHGEPLRVFYPPKRANAYYLPDEIPARHLAPALQLEQRSLGRLAKLEEWGRFIFDEPKGLRFDETALLRSYLSQIRARAWLTSYGGAPTGFVRDEFIAYFGDVLSLFGREFLGNLAGPSGGFLAPLLHKLPRQQHPLKHLLLMSFLFEAPKEFHGVYSASLTRDDEAEESLPLWRIVVRRPGKKNPGKPDRLPHIIDAHLEKHLVAALRAGLNKKQMADSLKVRPYTIEAYLLTHPELKSVWEAARASNRRECHRRQLAETLRKHPGLSITAARRLPGSSFRWLYLHDREWLREILPAIWNQ
ncbi:TnsD family Tn7-like transposition protein [Burkholderia pseudomallei]|uniref:TnsD family Tn7-like transposition protein n=1 Tax=Burkholderia pseudomallei TaxID=28450 RepID=UPI00137936AC|nr:TnsD family Tn7-like transposition protein [Burkholderia pseudomallei]MBY7654628.1 TniQ family protein [Burkholderia pseudomallei]QUN84249.1 TniQ family protein [Burkholderia pseudomallei]QUN89199.1 TniQ family protein [Burkholderia pseudomallei]QUN96115.1 TniQ family protein [Burkholderia pseudomallei]QUO02146.1 TniQ family protein [Burkholderia pseudomallei]